MWNRFCPYHQSVLKTGTICYARFLKKIALYYKQLRFLCPPDPSDLPGRFKKTYELLNLRALKISPVNKIHIFQCMGKIFCVEFQRYPLKFHTKYLTHTLKDTILYNIGILRALRFKSLYAFLKRPPSTAPLSGFQSSRVRQYLINVVLFFGFGIKDLQAF